MKKRIALLLTAALTVPLAACGSGGGKDENAPVQTLGWFVMEREDGVALDDLGDQETYLVHVYDLIPTRARMPSSAPSHPLFVTLNETNTYEPWAPLSPWASPTPTTPITYGGLRLCSALEIDEVPAGSDPIRCVSVYKVNTNDLTENTPACSPWNPPSPYESARWTARSPSPPRTSPHHPL